jgi:hypothetical protein
MLSRQHVNAKSISAYEVMPAELVDKLIEERGGTFRVTFSSPGRKPNKSEEAIPKEYRSITRDYVDKAKITTRSVYFGGHKKRIHLGGKDEAQKLIEAGFSRQATRVALGVAPPTLITWVGHGRKPCEIDLNLLPENKIEKYRAKGLARCEQLEVSKSQHRMPNFALEVGYAMAVLKKWRKHGQTADE